MSLILVPPPFLRGLGGSSLLEPKIVLTCNIYFGDRNIFVRISQTLALLEEGMPKGEGFGYDISSKDT